ncbi:MAG: hypothetical protein JO123_09435 [Ktedonobacteraceae bacterium]|nr:hypothetical protein [Ktedonobacteraceae bacterium]
MTSAELAYAEKCLQQKWHDLVIEEQKGTPLPVLERLFHEYMLAVEEYTICVEKQSSETDAIIHTDYSPLAKSNSACATASGASNSTR